MDRLKRLFRRKDRKHVESHAPSRSSTAMSTPPAATSKRTRTPDDFADDAMALDSPSSPRKRVRTDSPALTLHQQQSRVDSVSASTHSSVAQKEPPRLDWAPRPAGGDLSNIFDNLSVNSAGNNPSAAVPRPRPLGPTPTPRTDPSAPNRRSLPPQALFARGLKRFNEETAARTSTAQQDAAATGQSGDGMSLDDILTQPLFGDRRHTVHEPAFAAGVGVDTTVHTTVAPGKQPMPAQ
ncbi:MAG: hypothetical protein INR71_02270 [Terriglobus roseus]|nr:hypothetical protein [Terriglobus roseus]